MGEVAFLPNRITLQVIPENFEQLKTTMAASVYMHGKDVCIHSPYYKFYVDPGVWLLLTKTKVYMAQTKEQFDQLALP